MYLLPKRIFSSSGKSSLSWHHHQFKLHGLTPCSTMHHYHWHCWYSAHFLFYDTLLPRYWTSRSKQNFTSKLVTRQGSHLTLKKASGLWNLAKQWHLKMVAFFFCPRRWVARWWEWHSSLVAKLLTHNQPGLHQGLPYVTSRANALLLKYQVLKSNYKIQRYVHKYQIWKKSIKPRFLFCGRKLAPFSPMRNGKNPRNVSQSH